MKNRFQRNSGCFTCDSCGRKTRSVGDNGDLGLCPECYEIAGLENAISDNDPDWEHRQSTIAEINRLREIVKSKGGK